MTFDFLLRMFRKGSGEPTEAEDNSLDPNDPFTEPVVLEFSDVIDLHSIPPRQVRLVVEEYIEEAHSRGVPWVRIIHGKGIGVQREVVRSILARSPFVVDFRDAPAEAGGWGATVVTLDVTDN
jgi:dsDNA-specific endonuclease/ATPase MutS2